MASIQMRINSLPPHPIAPLSLSNRRIDIHQIVTHDMQDLGEGAEAAAGDAVHEVREVEQDAARGLVAALVRHAVQAQGAAALDELVDQRERVLVLAVLCQHQRAVGVRVRVRVVWI